MNTTAIVIIILLLSWVIVGAYIGLVAAVAYSIFKILTKQR